MGGKAQITGQFAPKEAKLLVQRLNSGALPVPIELISRQSVGASLGEEFLNKAIMAGAYGLIAISSLRNIDQYEEFNRSRTPAFAAIVILIVIEIMLTLYTMYTSVT